MVSEIESVFAEHVYDRFISRVYDVEGFFSDNLIDEFSMELDAKELEIDLTNCK